MSHATWDLKISPRTFRKILKNPKDKNFHFLMARLLSRVPFMEVFRHHYITLTQFKKYYPKVRKQMQADLLGAGRIKFWNWLYKKIS